MKKYLLVVIYGICITLYVQTATATSVGENAVTRANQVIDKVLTAYGGAETINNMNTVSMHLNIEATAVGQSRVPGPPYDRNRNQGYNAIDFSEQQFFAATDGTAGGFEFNTAAIINGEDSYQLDYRAKTAAPTSQPDFDTASGPMVRVVPTLLVKQLHMRRGTSHWLGEAEIDGKLHDVITLVMQVGPALALYIDRNSGLITRSERTIPVFGALEYRFYDYQTISGIPFATRFEFDVNEARNLNIAFTDIKVNEDISNFLAIPDQLEKVAALDPDPMSTTKVDQGVYLIGGTGTYSLFIEMDDHIIAVGGTNGAQARIDELRKTLPDKPIKHAVMTHHHNDHIPGAPDFVNAGATLVTVAPNEAAVRAVLGDDTQAKFAFVDGKHVFTDGKRQVEIHNIGPTPHVENFLLTYLPKEGIIFEGDHFGIPRNGAISPAVTNTRAFAEILKARGFKIKKIVGEHSPAIGSMKQLETAVSMR